ncbi:MAG: hypothetical protein ING44_12030 [Telmatospirillum sp.]|nr:hypothetical protein [Telmatospirillum sp.]
MKAVFDRVEPVVGCAANLRKIEIVAVGLRAFALNEIGALFGAVEADFAVEIELVGRTWNLVFAQ